jgi:hypothetical protein
MRRVPCITFLLILFFFHGYGQDDYLLSPRHVKGERVIKDTVKQPIHISRDVNSYKDTVRLNARLRHVDTIHNNFFKLDVTRLLTIELFATYERKFTKWLSFETGVGIQFSDGGNFKINDIGGMSYYIIFPYHGVIVTLGPKFYHFFPRRPNIYFQPLFLYRYLWYNQMWTQGLENSDNYSLEDRKRNEYGISLNYGVMKKFNGLILDFSFGLGIRKARIKEIVYETAPYWDHSQVYKYNPPAVYYLNRVYPVINVSLKLGFGL